MTGIYGKSDVTKFLLDSGADPNIRSTYSEGLRMHPLSWNVYGGHLENIQLLLQYGADVNLDFDGMGQSNDDDNDNDNDTSSLTVTAMDVTLQLTKNEAGDDRFVQLEALLRSYGGKTIKELNEDTNEGTKTSTSSSDKSEL